MGYFDGLSFDSDEASSCHIARLTGTPAVLVANVRGMGRSLAALLRGFWEESGGTLRGVIFNRCSPGMYPSYRRLAESLSIPCYGYLPPLPEASLESRHLGLVTAEELPDLRKKLGILGRAAEETLDLDGLLRLADSAPPLCFQNLWEKVKKRFPVRLGVAKDRAFCFRYEDQMELFSAFGAELVPFSPLQDAGLPEGLDGLYLCGGYPENIAPPFPATVLCGKTSGARWKEGFPPWRNAAALCTCWKRWQAGWNIVPPWLGRCPVPAL